MDYGQGIAGCHVGSTQNTHHSGIYGGLYSKELRQDLLITLLEYPEVTFKLGFITKQNTLTKKAINELLTGLEINREKCFDNTPQWKLDWYAT